MVVGGGAGIMKVSFCVAGGVGDPAGGVTVTVNVTVTPCGGASGPIASMVTA